MLTEMIRGVTTGIVMIGGVSTRVVTDSTVIGMRVSCMPKVQEVRIGDQCTRVECEVCTNNMATWNNPDKECVSKTYTCPQVVKKP